MALGTNIARRAGSARYYARLGVPLDLQKALGRRELWKSLGTTDPKEARTRVVDVLKEWHDQFAELRKKQRPGKEDIQAAIWGHYTAEVQHLETERQALPTEDEIASARNQLIEDARAGKIEIDPADGLAVLDASLDVMVTAGQADFTREARSKRLALLRKHLANGETGPVEWAADQFIARNGWIVERGSPQYRDLCRKLQRSEIEALSRHVERDQGDYTGKPKDELITPPSGKSVDAIAKPGETVIDLFEQYARENPDGVKQDTLNQARMAVKLFVETVSSAFPASKIDKKAVREWKALLLQYPVKAAETVAFRGLSLKEIVKKNAEIGKPPISTRTVNRYLSGLGAFCNWLVAHDYLERNPLDGMHIRIDKGEIKTLPFSADQLTTLFKSPLFVGCQSDEKMHLPGNVHLRDHRYWLPLVMLYTGARPGEIAQMLTKDVRQMHDQWIMHIAEEAGTDKSTKTKGSMRVVPVHPELIKLGWIDYCEAMTKRGKKRLFPEAERNARGQMAAKFSRDFGRYLTRIGIKNGRGLSLYSFRHGFIDALRRAEFLDEQFGFLVGHDRPTTTGIYGILPQGMLRQRTTMIEAVRYPDLDLTHLCNREAEAFSSTI